MIDYSPVDMLAAWRLMATVGLTVVTLLMLGLVRNRLGSFSIFELYRSTPLIRLFAGITFAFAAFASHQAFWWGHEEIKALGNCYEGGKQVAYICEVRKYYYSFGPVLTPFFYLAFAIAATLAGAPLLTLNFEIEERTGHAIMTTILIVSGVVGFLAAATPW